MYLHFSGTSYYDSLLLSNNDAKNFLFILSNPQFLSAYILFHCGLYNFADILMALGTKKKGFLRTFQVIASTVLCYLMQFGYFAFLENVLDDIGKETHDTGFQ